MFVGSAFLDFPARTKYILQARDSVTDREHLLVLWKMEQSTNVASYIFQC